MKIFRILIIILIPTVFFACASADSEAGSVAEPLDKPAAPVEDGMEEISEPREPDVHKSARSEEAGGAAADDFIFFESEAEMTEELSKTLYGESGSSQAPSQSGLKAGFSDDNRQFGYFLNFLNEYQQSVSPLPLDVSERIQLMITDLDGKSVPGAQIRLDAGGGSLTGRTLADGSYQINPSELFSGSGEESINVEIRGGRSLPGFSRNLVIERNGGRKIEVAADAPRNIPAPVPLDIVFVMDTTGSMGEEIERLKNTIRIIHLNLGAMQVAADIRFGMVLYKDVEDEYRTEVIPLTSDLDQFQTALNEVYAAGGGDTPEDLEAALDQLINSMDWNPDAVKLSYIITDAPPHLDYQSSYTCSDAAVDARKMGLKIFGIGTGGLDLQGEYVLRQIAQYTSARYIFLTYGSETGESSGGSPGSVSHHTGSNWNADKLESIIIRFTREELAHLTDNPLPGDDPWFEAGKIEDERG